MNASRIESATDVARAIAHNYPSPTTHVSLIYCKTKLIAVGTNLGKTHTRAIREGYYSPIPHSELAAFIKVPYTQRDNLRLVNFRFNRQGDLRISDPCKRCLPWCQNIFKEIWASQSDGSVRKII